MDDFQIRLSATIADFTSLDKQIQSHFDSKRFKINVDANVSGGGVSTSAATGEVDQRAKILNAIEKTIAKRKEEEIILEKNQAAATNRALEEEYQNRIKIRSAIEETIKKRKEEEAILEKNQAAAINKALDDNFAAQGRQAKRINQAAQSYENLTLKLKNARVQGKITAQQFNDLSQKAANVYDEYKKTANSIEATATNETKLVEANRQLKNGFADTNRQLSALNAETQAHSQDIDKILVKYLRWYLLAGLVSGVQNSFKKVVEEVKRMDAALVELNKVADLTDAQMQSIKQQAFDIGTNVGKTATEVLDAATAFKRAGYSIQESMNLAETALIMTNVAEGIKDAGTAAEYLVSILKGAKLPISEATHLLDALNEISNTQAVSFDNLADMTQRAAGTLNTLGNSIEETMALITGAYEVLQDERVAKGISFIGLRLAGLNEDMERQAGLQSKINKALMEYTGISVFDSTRQLRSTFDILQDLAGVWGTLSVNVQAYLTTLIAGKNRADVMSAALSNWENVEKSLNSALDSTGSALQEQQRYLDSIEGKQEALANAWQKLADDTMSSDFIKGIIEFATWFVNLIDKMGGLVPVITVLVGLLLQIKSAQIADYIGKIVSAFTSLKTAATSASAAVSGLQAAFGWIGIIATAIGFLVQVISLIVNSVKDAQEAAEKARQSAIESSEKMANNLIALRKEYSTLASKEVKTAEDEKRLLDIQKSLALSFGGLRGEIDETTASYDDWLKVIDKKTVEAWKTQLAAMTKDIDAANAYFENLGKREEASSLSMLAYPVEKGSYFSGTWTEIEFADMKKFSKESLSARLEELKLIKESRNLTFEESKIYDLIIEEIGNINTKSQTYTEILEKQAELEKNIADGIAQIEFYESAYGKRLNEVSSALNSLLSDAEVRVEQMEEESAELKKQKELQDKLLSVEKARLELAQARNKQIRVFRAGRGFVYESDESELTKAQENLTKALEELSEYKYQQEIENAKNFVSELNKMLSTDGDITKGWGEMLSNLGELTDEKFSSIIDDMKAKIIDFNKWVDENGGGSIISLGGASVNSYASGTSYASGGLSLVGEEGPELVNLPTGSRVYTASETKNMLGGLRGGGALGSTLVFNGDLSFPNVRNGGDAEGFINSLLQIGNNGKPQFI